MFNMPKPKEKVFTTGKLKLDGNSKEYPHTTRCQHPMCIQTTCKPHSPTHASSTPANTNIEYPHTTRCQHLMHIQQYKAKTHAISTPANTTK